MICLQGQKVGRQLQEFLKGHGIQHSGEYLQGKNCMEMDPVNVGTLFHGILDKQVIQSFVQKLTELSSELIDVQKDYILFTSVTREWIEKRRLFLEEKFWYYTVRTKRLSDHEHKSLDRQQIRSNIIKEYNERLYFSIEKKVDDTLKILCKQRLGPNMSSANFEEVQRITMNIEEEYEKEIGRFAIFNYDLLVESFFCELPQEVQNQFWKKHKVSEEEIEKMKERFSKQHSFSESAIEEMEKKKSSTELKLNNLKFNLVFD